MLNLHCLTLGINYCESLTDGRKRSLEPSLLDVLILFQHFPALVQCHCLFDLLWLLIFLISKDSFNMSLMQPWAQRRPNDISAMKLKYTITESPTPSHEGCQGELHDIKGDETILSNSEQRWRGFPKRKYVQEWLAVFALCIKVYYPKSPFS